MVSHPPRCAYISHAHPPPPPPTLSFSRFRRYCHLVPFSCLSSFLTRLLSYFSFLSLSLSHSLFLFFLFSFFSLPLSFFSSSFFLFFPSLFYGAANRGGAAVSPPPPWIRHWVMNKKKDSPYFFCQLRSSITTCSHFLHGVSTRIS